MSAELQSPKPEDITDAQFRAAGFTEEARDHPRDELSLVMLCAFNNVDPKLAPPAWWFFANDANAKAWDRVAQAARKYLGKETDFILQIARLKTDDETEGGLTNDDCFDTVQSLIYQARTLV